MNKKVIYLFIISMLIINFSFAINNIVIFYGQGCPHCEELLTFLDSIKQDYPNILIEKYEVYFNQSNRELLENVSNKYNTTIKGVPMSFINNISIVGVSDSVKEKIIKEFKYCSNNNCINPLTNNLNENNNNSNKNNLIDNNLTIMAIIIAAIVDAVNPCAFAVLILLITTISLASKNSKNKKKILFAGISFSTAIFISYYLMGIGIYSALNYSNLSSIFYKTIGGLSLILGILNLKDYFWYGKGFLMEVPISWRPKLKSLIKGVTSIPGAFLIGFVISLFLLPCTSGPYIVILGLLSKTATNNYARLLLLLYNLIFITPMLIITLIVYLGIIDVKKAEKIRKTNVRYLHLIAGILLLILGGFIILK